MTAGQNIQDILRQTDSTLSVIDAMALTLEWGCLFPTNPNTCRTPFVVLLIVAGIPTNTTDPFIIRELPDVYVVGNQSSFIIEKRRIGGKEVLLVALPSFASTGVVGMLNLNTLDIQSIQLTVDSIEENCMEVEEEKEEDEIVIDEDIMNEDGE